jgi:hypothetical protein
LVVASVAALANPNGGGAALTALVMGGLAAAWGIKKLRSTGE